MATLPGTKSIYSIIFRSGIVARKGWPKVATISEVHCSVISHDISYKSARLDIDSICNWLMMKTSHLR